MTLKKVLSTGCYSFLFQSVHDQAVGFTRILQVSLQHNVRALNRDPDTAVQTSQPTIHVQQAQVQSCWRSNRHDHLTTSARTRVCLQKLSSLLRRRFCSQ